MAGTRTRRSPSRNLPLTGKDELAGGAPGAPTKGSGTPTPTPAVFCAPSPAPAASLAPAPASSPAFTDELFKQFMKAYLEAQNQPPSHGQSEP